MEIKLPKIWNILIVSEGLCIGHCSTREIMEHNMCNSESKLTP